MRTVIVECGSAGPLLLPCFLITGRWSLITLRERGAGGLVAGIHDTLYRYSYQLSIGISEVLASNSCEGALGKGASLEDRGKQRKGEEGETQDPPSHDEGCGTQSLLSIYRPGHPPRLSLANLFLVGQIKILRTRGTTAVHVSRVEPSCPPRVCKNFIDWFTLEIVNGLPM